MVLASSHKGKQRALAGIAAHRQRYQEQQWREQIQEGSAELGWRPGGGHADKEHNER